MQLPKYFFGFLATAFLIVLKQEAGLGITITRTSTNSNFYQTSAQFPLGATTANVKLLDLLPVQTGGTPGFIGVVKNSFPDYKFISNTNNLMNSIGLDGYQAWVGYSPEGYPGVGANLKFCYNYNITSKKCVAFSSQRKFYWIQVISYKYIDISGLPHEQSYLDQVNNSNNPYYGFGSNLVTPNMFQDGSRRDANINQGWYAEVYLVEEIAPKKVIIFNGLSWGWSSILSPSQTGGGGCSGGSGGGGCTSANRFIQDQSFSSINNGTDYPTPISIPEPIPVLGLLALGIWGTFQGLKIIKDKK